MKLKCDKCKKRINTKISFFKCDILGQKCFYKRKNNLGLESKSFRYAWMKNG